MSVVEVNKLNGVPDFVRGNSVAHNNVKLTNSFSVRDDPLAARPPGPNRKLKHPANPGQ